MLTINLTEKDYEVIRKSNVEQKYSEFIFDEYRIIWRFDGYKNVIKKTGNEWEYKIIKGDESVSLYYFKNEKGELRINNDKVEQFVDFWKHKSNDLKRIANLFQDMATAGYCDITQITNYIMEESLNRNIVYKETKEYRVRSKSNKKNNITEKKEIYLLGEIINYVTRARGHHVITCECWGVRGHWRHYKDGKVIFIKSYKKGVNKDKQVEDKTYLLRD